MIHLKKIIVSAMLGLFLIGGSQKALATENLLNENLETSGKLTRITLKPWFKGIPPLKYKGRTRINYYPYAGGYTGVYL